MKLSSHYRLKSAETSKEDAIGLSLVRTNGLGDVDLAILWLINQMTAKGFVKSQTMPLAFLSTLIFIAANLVNSPKVTDKCTRCKNKLDYGDEYLCCTDCSDPSIIDTNAKLGYCKTGAELVSQIKPQGHFKWVAGPWMPCSSPCDGGVRYRDVECFGETEDRSIPRYPVDDSRCLGEEMPLRQEPCNLSSCSDVSNQDLVETDRGGMPVWLVVFLVLFGAVAIGGLGFAGYTMYKRRASSQHGFVYIMLEGYK
ncbi:hypothetical protein Sjap_011355 [Stephania japonica]|uniref:Uncharacterized protein n=1 Tax=Stephania japonica TaxID=461633 RepID=A0AAP0P4Z1_9MAGN